MTAWKTWWGIRHLRYAYWRCRMCSNLRQAGATQMPMDDLEYLYEVWDGTL